MDLLPHGVPYAALALGALLCFGLSIYFRTGDPGSKRGSPALNLFSGTGSQEPLRSARTPQQINVSSESEFTNGWWESSKIFDLERRAIFSKSWLYVTHRNQFTKAGDYHQFQIAGFQFFLILGKDNVLRGFHNVCRHRAYPVVRKESGNSTVLGCKYHGWAYNAQGALTKAPQFDNVAGFDKTQNGLFSIATKFMQGMVFVNFDPSKKSESPPAESYNMKSTISRALAERKCTHRWEFEGQFNWKVGLFYFGNPSHQSIGGSSTTETVGTQRVEPRVSTREPLSGILRIVEGVGKLFPIATARRGFSMRLFPTTTIHLCQDRELWYSISLMPHSPSRTIVKCEVYQLVPVSSEIQINPEIELPAVRALKDYLQQTVNACGEAFLRDHMYAGTSYGAIQTSESDGWELQTQILEKLRQHCKLERSAGEEIWPAFVGTAMTEDGKETDRLCRELESCATGLEGDVLDW